MLRATHAAASAVADAKRNRSRAGAVSARRSSPAMKIAVLGAEGCLGTRMIESFHLDEGPSVAAVTAHAADLTRAARFAIDLRVANLLDVDSLARSFAGCSA